MHGTRALGLGVAVVVIAALLTAPGPVPAQQAAQVAIDADDIGGVRDAVVYASGADHIADLVRPNVRCFEYRHAPDPGAVESHLIPHLAELRQRRAGQGTGAEATAEGADAPRQATMNTI